MDDSIQKAVEFIGLVLKDDPDADKLELIDTAAQKFNLNPLQAEFLTNKFL